MKIIYSAILLFLFTACNTSTKTNNTNTADTTNTADSVVFKSETIPVVRENINPKPVKTYAETIESFETTDQFKVGLYETKKTFNYVIKISYKGIVVNDTLRVPNFGVQPAVEIIKGDSIRPSCIVGFLDKDKQFRASKLIAFNNDKLKIKVLKHYAVYQSE